MSQTAIDSETGPLAAALVARGPRVLVVSAPAGYGKGALLRSYAQHIGAFAGCDLVALGDNPDLARQILDALVAGNPGRSARSAGDRLAQRGDAAAASSREALRREWPRQDGPQLFLVRDVAGALASPAGADVFANLVGTLPAGRTLAVSTRLPLPPALLQIVERESGVLLGPEDLALSRDAVLQLARGMGVASTSAASIYQETLGWPLVTRLLLRLMRLDSEPEALEAAASLRGAALLAFAAHRIIARMEPAVREALIVAALLPGATHLELVRVLGEGCDDLVFARLSVLPFVVFDGDRAIVHPEIVALLRARFTQLVKSLYERTLHVLAGEGAYVEGARIALEAGDVSRAAAIMDAAPPYTAAPVPLGEYERVIDRIDRTLITRFPNIWIATIPYRSFAVDRATFAREAETVYYCLPHGASPDQRAAALMLLGNAFANVGRFDDCDQLVEEGLRGFALEHSLARASLLNFSALLRGMEGRFAAARELADEAARTSRDRFGENQTLHYIDAHEAAFHGKTERVVVIVDELLRRLGDDLPIHRAHTATNGALFAWVGGDDDAFQRYIALLEESLTPGLERGFAPMIDAARGRTIQIEERYPWPVVVAVAQLYRMGGARDKATAVEAARAAVRAADQRRDPYVQILAHAALFVLDEPARRQEAAALEAAVAPVESPELQNAVRALLRGERAGILEPFVRRRVLREREEASSRLVVELLRGCVTRDGREIRLSDKEFELLALLGSSHGAVPRDRIGEAIWDHLDPEEWPNNLKVTLSRLRGKLGMRDAVLLVDGRYRLSTNIDVDLRRAESIVREALSRPLDDALRTELHTVVAAHRSSAASRYERFPWMQSLLARIDDTVSSAGVALAADALAQGRHDDALALAKDVAAIDPFNEAACETAIRVCLARGDVDSARREFRRYAPALEHELGATPSERLTELMRTPA